MRWRNAEHDLHALTINLNPPHKGSDALARAEPVKLVQPVANPCGKFLQAGDDEGQLTFGLGLLDSHLPSRLEASHACLQATDPRRKLALVNDPFAIAINEAADAPAQVADLLIQVCDLLG